MHFKKIGDLYEFAGYPAPENPLLGLIQFNSISEAFRNQKVKAPMSHISIDQCSSPRFMAGLHSLKGRPL